MNDSISILADFSDKVLAADSFSRLSSLLIENVSKAMRPQYASFMLFDLTSLEMLLEKRRGFAHKRSIPPTIEYCDDLEKCQSYHGAMFVLPDDDNVRFFRFFDPEEPHACELRLPFTLGGNYLGIVSLGRKKASKEYSRQELEYLQVITNYVSTATLASQLSPSISLASGNDNHLACSPSQCGQSLPIKPRIHGLPGKENFGLIGESPAMNMIRDVIARVAGEDVPVLITGESGTGKELIARAIHAGSKRAGKPLVAMNCAALPDSLVESELFGYEKGAFTGAMEQKKGKFEYANHSTLFLDEIGDMSLSAQSKLLRVLQDGTFYRVGGNSSFFSDVRIISASNRDLLGLAMNKQFREDLYYRLNVVQIEAPPLRQRGDDIQLLAEYYFDYFNRHYRKSLSGFSDEAMAWLMQHEYPGNVRELKNIIERAIIMERGDRITLASFPKMSAASSGVASSKSAGLRDLEREHIVAIMREVNFNKSEAARRLGIARKTLREKLQRYNITQI